MKRFFLNIFLITIFLSAFCFSAKTQNKIDDLNSEFYPEFSFGEFVASENYYYTDTCCIALELYQGQEIYSSKYQKSMFVFECSFEIDNNLENEKIALPVFTENVALRIFLNGNLIFTDKENTASQVVIFENEKLNFGTAQNELTLQYYTDDLFQPSLNEIFISSYTNISAKVFLNNLVRKNIDDLIF